ncbi:uncharacterized protein B0J16DRAFT_393191 [Fusarium flagelliforme]|uniref:uncharacterized protein n=1 Tax=Fusarium flagelliforme TaxID=2675880 RepID=UPI001E8DB45E|nr:uncharacterized protein B0J16DRAFT_393191 [Fusarium flagelliforme]KAH7199091.1 hypothetical protein B0J16DRAFT_393191 [Fusarium flagelliforme]
MESLYQVYPLHTVYEPPSLPASSLGPDAFEECRAPLQELTTRYANPITVCSAKRGQASDCLYNERAKKPKISQVNPKVDSINLSSSLLLPNPGIQINTGNSATISEDQLHAGLQAMLVLELKALEESALGAFEYSGNVVVFGKKLFPVPMGSEINILTYPQRAMPAYWNTAVQRPSDRILLAFYWFAICTGKSLIPETNPWLDFVIFQNSLGIQWAILCLAAMHLHDHVSDKRNEDRVIRNHGFGYRAIQLHKRAVGYLRTLLDNKQDGSSREIISLLIVLSTIDEKCWNQKIPKSLKDTLPIGFGESQPTRQKISQLTSHHDTYPTNPMGTSPTDHQHSHPISLHMSQAVLVAQGIILAQVMSKLPQPERFVPLEESRRFSWLLQASSEEVWTIHGGCGASPKLLHIMSQINYCAARLHQDGKSIVVPITAKKLLQLLYELKSGTAYAWLLTAIIYLQCRVQRYPPSHPYVGRHLEALAKCIQAVPTSGPYFTANAPILPVFLLGLLSAKNKGVAQDWFERVLQVPVRSKQIWPSAKNLPYLIQEREPWWEKLVDRLLVEAGGMLCFM